MDPGVPVSWHHARFARWLPVRDRPMPRFNHWSRASHYQDRKILPGDILTGDDHSLVPSGPNTKSFLNFVHVVDRWKRREVRRSTNVLSRSGRLVPQPANTATSGGADAAPPEERSVL